MWLLAVGSGPDPGAQTDFWKPTPHARLPYPTLMQRRSLVLSQLEVPSYADVRGRSTPSEQTQRSRLVVCVGRGEMVDGMQETEGKIVTGIHNK